MAMGFVPSRINQGHMQGWEYLPAGAITPKVGLALTQTSGLLTVASGTTRPTYLCMMESGTALTAGDIIPVIHVDDNALYDVTNSAAFTSIKVGDKVTISADGMQVTATKTDGVAEVVNIGDTAVGSEITVRFPG